MRESSYVFVNGVGQSGGQSEWWKIISSLLLGSLDLRLDFTDPSNPIFTGTTGISVS
jgi:hypothetical protein